MDELQQGMTVNERLKDETKLPNILRMKCAACISEDIARTTALLGSDSEDDQVQTRKRKGKDSMGDPLSDSLPDKNKLSRSEKSLQKPLKILQEEVRQVGDQQQKRA